MGRREYLIAILGLFIGGLVFVILLSPRVTHRTPQSRSYSAWEPITVTFNQPISTNNLGEVLTISPPVSGEIIASNKQLIFEPSEPLSYGQTYSVELGRKIRGRNNLPVLSGKEWSFTVGDPRLLFLREIDNTTNLWLREGNEEKQLTQEKYGVWDYHIAPNGRGIIYSVIDDDDTIDLIQLTLDGDRKELLDCQDSRCIAGRLRPDGSLLAFERQRLGDIREKTEVWILETNGGGLRPAHDPELLAESGFESLTSHSPRWSADGRYLSYFKPEARVIIVVNLAENTTAMIPANMEIMGDWSPVAYDLAYTELAFGQQGEHEHRDEVGNVITHTNSGLFSHVVLTNLENGETVDLSQGKEVNDGAPAWQPDGGTVATGRTLTGSGQQMWALTPSDGEARPLTDDPFKHHTSPAWSPDGKRLAFMQVGLVPDGEDPNIMILNLESGELELAAENAFLPNWWP
jgi:Tol biopolymer transport system component